MKTETQQLERKIHEVSPELWNHSRTHVGDLIANGENELIISLCPITTIKQRYFQDQVIERVYTGVIELKESNNSKQFSLIMQSQKEIGESFDPELYHKYVSQLSQAQAQETAQE